MSDTKKATGRPAPPVPDLDALLGEEGRPEKVVPICLRGHLQAEWDRLKAEFDAGPGDDEQSTLVARANKRRIAEQMAEVEAKMRAGTVEFRLRALPRRRTAATPKEQVVWQELVAKHPPRKDAAGKVDQRDSAAGVNMATFADELVRASIVEPELTEDQWAALDDKLSDAQFDLLLYGAWNINRNQVDVPFSRAASIVRNFDAESRRRSDSALASNASKAGNRSRSRSTDTTSKDG